MDETRIRTLEEVGRFLAGTTEASLKLHGGKDDVYAWIERTLVRFRYMWLGKKDRGLVLGYIKHLSGYVKRGQFYFFRDPALPGKKVNYVPVLTQVGQAIPQDGPYPAQAAHSQGL